MAVTSKQRSDPALISIRCLIFASKMDKLSAPVLLSKDHAPMVLNFEEYALNLATVADLSNARVLAMDVISCNELPLNE